MEVRNSSQGLTLTEGRYVYSWLISYNSCEDAKRNKSLFACVSEHIKCHNINDSKLGDHLGYRCRCDKGYTGNPYVQNGCQDINECKDPNAYICTCEPGTYGNPKIGECIPHTKKSTLMFVLIIAAGNVGLLLLCVMLVILRKKWKEIMQKQIRKKNFLQNRGLLLQKLISAQEHDDKGTKLFPLGDIEKATDNFDEKRIVGRGGYGVVYKGILSDQRVIAVKKSPKNEKGKFTDKSDVYSFGIVLLELLTGRTPNYSTKHGDQDLAVNLSKQFLQAMRENHALDLVEDRVLKEGNKEELLEIMQMIEMCLRLKGEERPTMKEVEHKLLGLRMTKKRLPSFTEDNDITQTNLSDATELVDQKNHGTSTSYSSEKDLIYQQSYSLR